MHQSETELRSVSPCWTFAIYGGIIFVCDVRICPVSRIDKLDANLCA